LAEARATTIAAFDADTRDVIEKFDLDAQDKVTNVDIGPRTEQ